MNCQSLIMYIYGHMRKKSDAMTEREKERAAVVAHVDLIDRADLKWRLDELIVAVAKTWGAGSTEHNLVRDICDALCRVPSYGDHMKGTGDE